MTGNKRIQHLLEIALSSETTPEELCRDCPEMLPELKKRWDQLQRVNAEIDALFPDSTSSGEQVRPNRNRIPNIPGYEIHGELGRGGMGVVYKAWHRDLERPVALKMLLAGAYASPLECRRLMDEAKSIATLHHNNIVTVHDVGEIDGLPFFTMELVDGQTLAKKLSGTPLPAKEAAELCATLADAVHVAHLAGIVHQDLKPGNVLMSNDAGPKILDFGLARRFHADPALTLGLMRAGTPSYMAPEVAKGAAKGFCPKVDIYSLGALFYEMLTGRPPFQADSIKETERQLIEEQPVPPSRLNQKVPRDLETICLKCLRKEPDQRYETAAALADDIKRFLDGKSILARPISRFEKTVRWTRRHPAASAFIVTLSVLIALAIGIFVREWQLAVLRHAELEKWSDRLAIIVQMQNEGRFGEARAILLGASDAGSSKLRAQIEEASEQLTLVERLDRVRMSRGSFMPGGGIDYQECSDEYEAVFRKSGLGEYSTSPEIVAARLKDSPIRSAIVAALDDWAACATAEPRAWILQTAKLLDPDPWRNNVRSQEKWADTKHLEQLAESVNVQRQPVTIMVAMGTRWRRLGGDPTEFLKKVQRQFPNDFWVNFELGHLFGDKDLNQGIAYCRAALAIRPDAAPPHYNISVYLALLDQHEESFFHANRVIEINPTHAFGQINVAAGWMRRQQFEKARTHYQTAVDLDPQSSNARAGRRLALLCLERFPEVLAAWKQDLQVRFQEHADWDGYAELALYLDDTNQHAWACNEMLRRFGDSTDPRTCERIGRACLLNSVSPTLLERGTEMIDRALKFDPVPGEEWTLPYFIVTKALSEYRYQRYDNAAKQLEGQASKVLVPAPQLISAMIFARKGEIEQAETMLELANDAFNLESAPPVTREVWMIHLLRNEAEKTIAESKQ